MVEIPRLIVLFYVFTPGFAQKVQENMCEQEFQAINEDILAKAQLKSECTQFPIPEKDKKAIMSSSTELALDGIGLRGGVRIIDLAVYVCNPIDEGSEFMIQSFSMKISEELMKDVDIEIGDGCITQLFWLPKNDNLQWIPSSNYGWIDMVDVLLNGMPEEVEQIGGYYLLSSNKALIEVMSSGLVEIAKALEESSKSEMNPIEVEKTVFGNSPQRNLLSKDECLENYHRVHDEIMEKIQSTMNCSVVPEEGHGNHDERRLYNCTSLDIKEGKQLELVLGMIFITEGTFVNGCQLYVSWPSVSDFDWTPANQKEDWVGFTSNRVIYGGIAGRTMNWVHANTLIMEAFSQTGTPVLYKKVPLVLQPLNLFTSERPIPL